MEAVAVCLGTGILTMTPRAKSLLPKVDLIFTLHSMRVLPSSLTMGRTRKGRCTPSVMRYFMRSNSPSGGTKDTQRSVWKRPRFTHWWKVTSSSSICLPEPDPWAFAREPPSVSRVSLSFSPNLRSGIPERKHFMSTFPLTSDRSTVPFADMRRLTLSIMSRNTSFFLYLIPSRRCPTAPVTCRVALLFTASVFLSLEVSRPCWVMYSFRISGVRI
mmetsp:Transcript_28611/g.39526  ORF Transcript_28611/g.39526 Transcript_28611/m.39526 type:complete len:216 (-) Transcript_28611:382-1029(-)